jgi:hypothetical protein
LECRTDLRRVSQALYALGTPSNPQPSVYAVDTTTYLTTENNLWPTAGTPLTSPTSGLGTTNMVTWDTILAGRQQRTSEFANVKVPYDQVSGSSYNDIAFDGPYLRTRYDMGGVATQRVFGTDYPYDTALYGGLKTGESARQFFNRALSENVTNDRDVLGNKGTLTLSRSGYNFSAGTDVGQIRFASPPSVSMSFRSGSGSTGSGVYKSRGFSYGF